MSTHDQNPLEGVDAEALREVLAAAAGPARPAELSGEAAALAAYRAARPVPARADCTDGPLGALTRSSLAPLADLRSKPAMKTKLAAVFTAKAAAVALVATSMGGVALAATTGNLPADLPGGKSAAERDADKADRVAEQDADAAARAVEKAAKDVEKAGDKAAREAAKVAEANGFAGLCNAFLHHSDKGKGKWADSAAFTRLRTAGAAATDVAFDAFDSVKLTDYCNGLLTPVVPVAPAGEDAAPGKSGASHGKSGDAAHGKSATAGENGKAAENHGKGKDAAHGKDADAAHGKSATAGGNGKGAAHKAAGADNGQDGDDHGNAGVNGNGAENGGAGDDHGKAGEDHPAAKS